MVLRRELYGRDSGEVQFLGETLVREYNAVAMECLRMEMYQDVQDLLKKAYVMTEHDTFFEDTDTRLRLRAITHNNFGCMHKRRGRLSTALKHLEKAVRIEMSTPSPDNPAGTHLNMCAVLSLANRHERALHHANTALELILQHEATVAEKAADERSAHMQSDPDELGSAVETAAPVDDEAVPTEEPTSAEALEREFEAKDDVQAQPHVGDNESGSMLPVAYHNIGAELEHLGQYDHAVEAFLNATNLAKSRLGAKSDVTKAMQHSLAGARKSQKSAERSGISNVPATARPWVPHRKVPGAVNKARAQPLSARRHIESNRVGAAYERKLKSTPRGTSKTLPALTSAHYQSALAHKRLEWERLPWNHVACQTHEKSSPETRFQPPVAQPSLATMYSSQRLEQQPEDQEFIRPAPPPRLPPGTLYRPARRTQTPRS